MSDTDKAPDGVEDLRLQIDHTRDELADTVQALAAKADVKGRATVKAHEVRDQATVKAQEVRAQAQAQLADRPWLVPAAGAGGLIALLLGAWLAIRRHKS